MIGKGHLEIGIATYFAWISSWFPTNDNIHSTAFVAHKHIRCSRRSSLRNLISRFLCVKPTQALFHFAIYIYLFMIRTWYFDGRNISFRLHLIFCVELNAHFHFFYVRCFLSFYGELLFRAHEKYGDTGKSIFSRWTTCRPKHCANSRLVSVWVEVRLHKMYVDSVELPFCTVRNINYQFLFGTANRKASRFWF